MTEITDNPVKMAAPVEQFVLHWGELGSQWGVNRSVSQIHALLYVSERPLTAEAIAAALGMARSNVSTSLKELLVWDLVRRAPVKGDRREHFEAETDVWEMVLRIARGRKAREFDPAVAALRASVGAAEHSDDVSPAVRQRLGDLLSFTLAIDSWATQMSTVPKSRLAVALRLGSRILSFIPKGKGG